MPEICRFYGVVIRIYFADHSPPHFHANYGEAEALISISDLRVLAGSLPARALGLVMEWAFQHRDEIMRCWDRAAAHESPGKVEPLP